MALADDVIRTVFDRWVYSRLDDDQLQAALLQSARVDDRWDRGDTAGAVDEIFDEDEDEDED